MYAVKQIVPRSGLEPGGIAHAPLNHACLSVRTVRHGAMISGRPVQTVAQSFAIESKRAYSPDRMKMAFSILSKALV